CSTRPDCLDAAVLRRLREGGCTTVELGIQSFAPTALALAGRGYDSPMALAACALVREAGLALGVQLLPGMPGVDDGLFLADVRTALSAGAHMLRFYPCLVLEGTPLARWWREGRYRPWDMEQTLAALARGWLLAQAANVPVIRMGLAPEPSLAAAVLAGPVHPALGARVMARALLLAVAAARAEHRPGKPLHSLEVPRHCQGHFWGHRGELREKWGLLGIGPHNLHFRPTQAVRLVWSE
ncbi:MAG: radical SAM protein, partial [Desulfovibrionaceae bacterium]|nr:radical SAM protein [Desulfovibrionaceae bacterium]